MTYTDTFHFVEHYSGLIAMTITWAVVVAYSLFKMEVQIGSETISTVLRKHKTELQVVTLWLFIGAFFQWWFLWYILGRFSEIRDSWFVFVYISMSVATVISAAFLPTRFHSWHYYAGLVYFCMAPAMMFLFAVALGKERAALYMISLVCASVYAVGEICLIVLKKSFSNTVLEMYGFLILSVWAVSVTFI